MERRIELLRVSDCRPLTPQFNDAVDLDTVGDPQELHCIGSGWLLHSGAWQLELHGMIGKEKLFFF